MQATRRVLIASVALAAFVAPALGQAPSTLRIGITSADIPLTSGQPDSGFEGANFTGQTLYDALIRWDQSSADKASGIIPGLALSWSVDERDLHRWTFRLRPGVKFHDGSDFNADSVLWNFEKVMNNQAPQFDPRQSGNIRARLPSLASWRKIDDLTVELVTKTPDGFFPYALTYVFFSSPVHWEKLGRDWSKFAARPSGTGPWRLERLVPRERAEFIRNPAYWDQARVPKTERLVLVPIPEASTRTAALLSGQIDWIEAPGPDALPRIRSSGFKVTTNTYPHIWPYQLSFAEGSPWNDVRVRRAANLAIDRGALKEVLGGLMEPAAGMVTRDSPWFGTPTFQVKYDLPEARRLLAEVGATPQKPLVAKVLISPSGAGQMQPLPMNEFIQEQLGKAGIKVEFEVVEWQTLFGSWRLGTKDPGARGANAINVSTNVLDPFSAFVRFFRSDMAPPTSFNWGYINNPAFDDLLRRAQKTFDKEGQDRLLAELHGKVVDEATHVWVAHDLQPRAMSARVQGFVQARNWFQDLSSVQMR